MSQNKKDQFIDLLEERVAEYEDEEVKIGGRFYKLMAERLGFSPWKVIVPIALGVGFGLVFMFRGLAVRGVSWLQWGF